MHDDTQHIRTDTVEATTLRARRIELVDGDAKPRMKLYVSDDGTPVITLMDSEGADRMLLTLSDDSQGWIAMRNADGGNQFSVAIDKHGEPTMFLFDKNHALRMAVYVEESAPSVIMYDAMEKQRLAGFLESDGKPYLMLFNGKEESQAKITVADDGSECLILEDREGEEIRIPMRAPREL